MEKLLFNDDVLPAIIPGYRPGDAVPAGRLRPGDEEALAVVAGARGAPRSRSRSWRAARLRLHGGVRGRRDPGDGAGARQAGAVARRAVQGAAGARSSGGSPTTRSATRWGCGTTSRRRPTRSTTTTSTGASGRRSPTVDVGVGAQAERVRVRVGDGLRRALQQRRPRPGQVRHRGDPLRLRAAVSTSSTWREESAWTGLRSDISLRGLHQPASARPAARTSSTPPATTVVPYQAVHRPVDDEFRKLATNGGRRATCSPSGPTSSASDMFEGNLDCKTWDRGANQQEMVSQRHRAVPELLRLQRLPARADQLGDRRLPEPAAGALLQPLLGGVPVLLLPVGLPELRPRRRSVPGVGRFAQRDRGHPADAGARHALPDGAQPDGRDVPGGRLRPHRREPVSAGQAASSTIEPAGREAVLHQLLRRLLLHVHARRVAAARSCRRWSR